MQDAAAEQAPEPGWWQPEVSAISLFSEDLAASTRFYQDQLGLPLVHQDETSRVFQVQNLVLNVLAVASAAELVEPGAVAAADAGSRFQLSVWVEDVDAVCAQLTERGVTLATTPRDRPWGMRTATFLDPSGHSWEVASPVPAAGQASIGADASAVGDGSA